jgi:hypothetical protein
MGSSTPHAITPPDPAVTPTAACPVNPRPRDLDQYRAAVAASEGDPVEEINASAVRQDMTIWFPDPAPGRWRPVKDSQVIEAKTVIDFVVPRPHTSSWTVASTKTVCRRITARELPSVVPE